MTNAIDKDGVVHHLRFSSMGTFTMCGELLRAQLPVEGARAEADYAIIIKADVTCLTCLAKAK